MKERVGQMENSLRSELKIYPTANLLRHSSSLFCIFVTRGRLYAYIKESHLDSSIKKSLRETTTAAEL